VKIAMLRNPALSGSTNVLGVCAHTIVVQSVNAIITNSIDLNVRGQCHLRPENPKTKTKKQEKLIHAYIVYDFFSANIINETEYLEEASIHPYNTFDCSFRILFV
jgi:hypothetical protein